MMENKKGKNKTGIVVISAVFVLIAAAVILFLALKKEAGYRLIQVYEVNGSAVIEREDVGSMEAYENLNLKSQDLTRVMEDSTVRLKMDEDKYMLAEAESVFRIFATGTSENSRTDLKLEQGAITMEIQNKLSDGSSYQVTTPNSVMAVRGTVFRAALEEDAEGYPVTRFTCFADSISVAGLDAEGNLQEEQVIDSGREALAIRENGDTVIKVQEIDYETLPIQVLEYLSTISQEGRALCWPTERILEMIEERKNAGRPTASKDAEKPAEEPKPDTLTVTFEYEGHVFGTQEVKYGEKAQKPKLKPAPAGSWEFDFDTSVTEDTVILFKAS